MKNIHHVFCKKWRKSGKKYHETKTVDVLEHRAWHNLVNDKPPEMANRRIWAVIFIKSLSLTKAEKYAKSVLMRGRTQEECYKHCVKSFLPTGIEVLKPLSYNLLKS